MREASLYIFLISLYLVVTVTRVVPDGFHPDSLVYMSMGRNLAEDGYSLWNLHFTENIFNEFYEHPPLGIYLISLCFSLFGDTILVDKLYGVFFGLLIMVEIMAIYRLVAPQSFKAGMLLSAFYFILFPITSNTLENNLLEIPAAFFALGSVYVFLKGVIHKRNTLLYSFLFTLLLVAAFLSKGPVALFPFAVPFFYFALFFKEYKWKQMLFSYLLIILFMGMFSLAFYMYEPSHHYFSMYIDKQIIASINGSRGEGEHFKLLSQLLVDLSSFFIVSLIAIFAGRIKPVGLNYSKMFLLFLLIGLSASIPLEISPKQHDYYIFPALPYFAISLAILFTDPLVRLLHKLGGYKLFLVLNIVIVLVLIVVLFKNIGASKRHAAFYHDFIDAKIEMHKDAKINVCAKTPKDYYEFFKNTEITGNLERFYHARLYDNNNSNADYFLTTLSSKESCNRDVSQYEYLGVKEPSYYLLYRVRR